MQGVGLGAGCDESWRTLRAHTTALHGGPMKKVIAIVEDEPAIRDNDAAAFQRHGYSVRTYGERKEAIEAFRGRLPDLAVIDVGLRDEPEGGFELCRELRSLSAEQIGRAT